MCMKKYLSIFISVLLLVGVLSACSSGKKKSGSSASKDGEVAISWFDGTWERPVPEPNSEGVKKLNEKFDVNFKPQYIPWDTYEEKLSVKMASGDIPDVVGTEGPDVNFMKWAGQGAFLPLNDYIDKYERLSVIPEQVWDAVSLDGNVYGIPVWFPPNGGKKPLIRQDWLDNLGLEMPTNYEELKEVAIAFATEDPDGNGKDDTVGLGLAKDIVYDPAMGTYWSSSSWYHKNDEGQLIPGWISEGNKDKITFLHELSEAGALDKDWAVKPYSDVFKDFNANKVGIWYEQPGIEKGAQPINLDIPTLRKTAPEADVVPIPAFEAPDGSRGISSASPFYRMWSISADLKDDPEKVEKILEMIDYMQIYVAAEDQTPDNEYFDWSWGGEGKGYEIVDGVPQKTEEYPKYAPLAYIPKESGWTEDNKSMEEYATHSKAEEAKEFNKKLVEVLNETDQYVSPMNRIHSEVYNNKMSELNEFATNELTKMIVGQRPVADWDQFVDEYLARGGQEVIDDVNTIIDEAGIEGEWEKANKE